MNKFNLTKNVSLLAIASLVTFSACNDDEVNDPNASRVAVKATAATSSAQTASANSLVISNGFDVTTFNVNVTDVEFEYEDVLINDRVTDLEIELRGPFNLSLIRSGAAQTVDLGIGQTPNGRLEEVEFEITRTTGVSSTDPMLNKSILIEGNLDGRIFSIWTDVSEDFEIEEEDGGYVLEGDAEFILQFYVDRMLANIDFSTATDGNDDGIIEIGPGNIDGNGALYSIFRNQLEDAIEFDDDDDDDDDDND
ncbi:hypothetical protein [Penaeicola halotolerans]|uniref:hypothetical protein n=1 Tax=Penaeicola halotolerans TaxID=2793196 RepID=UPI001CF8D1C1|nr:hypothetical protein [Penaeicola halotolerans]